MRVLTHPPTHRRFAPDIWSFGCLVADTMIGSGARLFEPHPGEVRSTAQLLTIIYSFGTPSQTEILAMNPALQSDPHLYHWLRLPPMPPVDDWRDRLAQYVRRDEMSAAQASSNWQQGAAHILTGGSAGGKGQVYDNNTRGQAPTWWQTHQLTELLEEATQFLATILRYDPNLRPSADALARSPFLFCL